MTNMKRILKEIGSNDSVSSNPIPIWILNETLNKADLSAQIQKMQEQGVTQFVVRPEKGVSPEYPSAEFTHFLGHILREAKARKMSALFADDLLYGQTGTAQELTDRNPDYRLPYLSLHSILKIKGPRKIVQAFDAPDLKYFFALKAKDKFLDFSSAKNLSACYSGNEFKAMLPAGDWRIFVFRINVSKRSIGSYVLNCFSPEASRAYIDRTFARLKRDLPRDAVSALTGFHLELPNIAPDTSIRGIPWTENIFNALKGPCHADLMTCILALYIDNYSARNGLIRRTYYRLLQELLYNSFIRPVQEFGAKNHLKMQCFLTAGDLFSGETILKFDYTPLISRPGITGIMDHSPFTLDNSAPFRLFSDLCRGRGVRVRTVLGRNKNAISNSLKDLKFESDRLTVSGLHDFVIDGHYYKMVYRPGQKAPVNPFVQAGSFSGYRSLLNLLGRKQVLFSDLPVLEEVGVLFPAQSLYMAYNPSNLSIYKQRMANFEALVRQITLDDIQFQFMTEDQLSDITVTDKGQAVLGSGRTRASFRVLILPETVILSKKAVAKLEKFVQKGGRLIFFGIIPYETFEGGRNPKLLANIEKFSSQASGTVHKLAKPEELETLKALCQKSVQRPVEIFIEADSGRRVLSRTYLDGETQVHLFLNASAADSVKTEIRFNQKGQLHYLDLNTGHASVITVAGGPEGVKTLSYNFAPAESAVFVVTPKKIPGAAPHFSPVEETNRIFRIILKDEWALTPLDLNALPLNAWSMRMNGNREINSGFNFSYESYINVQNVPGRCMLMMNQLINLPINGGHSGRYPVEISFNGVILKNMHFFGRGEKAFHETETVKWLSYAGVGGFAADVTAHVRKGINRVTVKTYGSAFAPLQITSPLIFLGDFALKRGNQGWLLVQRNELFTYGSWTEQGFPYYCGRGVYSQIFEKPGNFKKVLLRFKNFEAAAAVRVNGADVPLSPWQPVIADISRHIQSEKNKIEIEVANTPTNLLKLMNMPAGLTAEVYMDVYQ